MNMIDIFSQQALNSANAVAITETRRGRDRSITFAELDELSKRAAGMLQSSGLRPGDKVLLLQPMSIDLYVALIALFRLGLVATVLDPSAGRAHIARCCEIANPQAFIGSSKAHLLRLISPAIRSIQRKYVIGSNIPGARSWNDIASSLLCENAYPSDADTPAILTFTSGSTGQPKAVLRTHGLLLAQHRSLVETMDLQQGEVDLTTLPIFALANLASGVTSVIPDADLRFPGAVNPVPIIKQLEKYKATRTGASPAFLERLVDYSLRQGLELHGFRKVFTGGAPVFPQMLDKLQVVAPNAEIVAVYGSTEAEPIAEIAFSQFNADDRTAMSNGKGLLAGKPVSGIQFKIIKQQWGQPIGPYTQTEFESVCLPMNKPGEIVVSGEYVIPGYLNGVGNTETKFSVDGVPWHRTGDTGCLDERGRLWLLGRSSARIDDELGTLYPFAVECAAHDFPGIHRVAMVSHKEKRVLAVEWEADHKQGDVTALAKHLAWAQIEEIRMVERVPMDKRHNAKVDYPTLHALLDRGIGKVHRLIV